MKVSTRLGFRGGKYVEYMKDFIHGALAIRGVYSGSNMAVTLLSVRKP